MATIIWLDILRAPSVLSFVEVVAFNFFIHSSMSGKIPLQILNYCLLLLWIKSCVFRCSSIFVTCYCSCERAHYLSWK